MTTENIRMNMQPGLHLGNEGAICFLNGKLISVDGTDIMAVYDIKNDSITNSSKHQLSAETNSVCSNL